MFNTSVAQDDVVRLVRNAQQNRRDAEEHKKRNAHRRAAEIAAIRRRVRCILHFGDRAGMFFAGVSVALAVHFFVAANVVGLTLSIVCFYTFNSVSRYCDRRYHKKLKGRTK